MSNNVKAALTELIMRVGRSYYASHYIIIMDLLALRGPLREEDMARALCLSPGDTRKLCEKLKTDRMIKASVNLLELKHTKYVKKTSRTIYYIDYISFLNVVKYKMFKIQEVIRKEIDEYNNNLKYECPNCQAKYDPLAVITMMRPEDGLFVCDNCSTILVQEKGTDFENDLSRRFNMERMPILKILQELESKTIPEVPPPTEASLELSSIQGDTVQTYALPNQIKVELEGLGDEPSTGSGPSRGNASEESLDTSGFDFKPVIDNKDSVMQEYYARLQSQASDSIFSGAISSTITGEKRALITVDNEESRKRAKPEDEEEAEDSDLEGEEFEEI